MVKVVEKWMDFLIGVFLFVGLRRSLGLVGTGGVGSDGRKSHDRADSLTGSHGAQWPGTAGATAGAILSSLSVPLHSLVRVPLRSLV